MPNFFMTVSSEETQAPTYQAGASMANTKHGELQDDRPSAVIGHCFILIPFSVL